MKKPLLFGLLGAIGVLLLGAGGYWALEGRFHQSTDNALVESDMSVIAAKLSGYVTEVAVADNQPVAAGSVLLRLDDADARAALALAEASLEQARAAARTAGLDSERQQAAIAQAEAQRMASAADAQRAQSDFRRYEQLRAEQWASVQKFDQAKAQAAQAQAAVAAARAAEVAATRQLGVLSARQSEAVAQIHAAEARVAQARLDLANTVIRAPIAGTVGNRTVRAGQYVRPGAQLLVIVPDRTYVVANFKETQIGRIRLGQPARLSVDAYPGVDLEGVIHSFAPASGSMFALLPPENATGNYTKIVQRVPVRIEWTQAPPAGVVLRPGMSVEVDIDVRGQPLTTQNAGGGGQRG